MRQLKIATQITNRDSQAVEKYLQEISKISMITPEEETILAQKIKMGDQRALDKLVQANLRFVVSVAKQYQHQGLSLSDLINEGNLGLIKAAQRFDETKGFKFISYAVWWIRQNIMLALVDKNITLIDYECLEHEDGQRIIGFGFFAGIVGAHNGVMAYGKRTRAFELSRVFASKDYRELIHTYFGLKLPNIKIAVTGSGRVAHGILDVMNLMGITEVEPDEYLERNFTYPVYVQLKGHDLYTHKELKTYKREHFHEHPTEYRSRFLPYTRCTDILMNGIYWDINTPRLFEKTDIDESFTINTIADITDDENGSVPINLGDNTIEDPVYGVSKTTFEKTAPYIDGSIDIMAVGNLPNELPRDASRYFGEQLIKHILTDLLGNGSEIIERATILKHGKLTPHFKYLEDYAAH